MTASPVMTTPRLSSRSASSSSESSSSLGALRLTNDSGTPLVSRKTAEPIRRPWSRQAEAELGLGPSSLEVLNHVDELVLRIAPHQHARAEERPFNALPRRRQ